jgi:hypothetical protein
VIDGSAGGEPTKTDLESLASSSGGAFPFIADNGGALYYGGSANIYLVAPGGQIVATGEYASDIPAETIESVLP